MSNYFVTVEAEESVANPAGQINMTTGDWLVWQMRKQNLSNTELRDRLLAKGYRCSRPFIANMRTNQSKIPLALIPLLVECVVSSTAERQHWELELLRAYLPESIHRCLRNPLEERKRRVFAMLRMRKVGGGTRFA
ncbi:MAG: hypothetical protein ACREPY_13330 [Rhodanobacteraceae bacterium]